MKNKLFIKQNGYKDCATACVLSIMKYYGYEASYEEINYLLKTDKNGTNAYNLIEGIRLIGFDGYGIHYTIDDIMNKNITFPIICHVLKDGMYHFVVVYKINNKKDYLYVMDPAYNMIKIKREEFNKIYLNTSLIIYPVKNVINIDSNKTLKEFIIEYISLEKKLVIKIIILSFIVIILGIISNFYSMILIDNFITNFNKKIFILISTIFLINYIFKNIFLFLRNKFLIITNNSLCYRINSNYIRHFFDLPYLFFKNKSSGEVISRLNDLKNFNDMFSNLIVNISTDIVLIICSMIILLIINSKLFLIFLISMILYFIVVLIYRNNYKNKTYLIQETEAKYNKKLTDSILGYETNKNLNMISNIKENIDIKYLELLRNKFNYDNTYNKQNLIKNLIIDITYFISILIGIIIIYKNKITIGEFMLFNSIIFYFTEPLKDILDFEPNNEYFKNTFKRINDITIMKKSDSKLNNYELNGNIIFNNVSYSYNNIKNTFNNINFKIKEGDKFLIYGNSGCGKSTLMKILLKYIDNYKGDIHIGNINIKDINEQTINKYFTYVSQNNYIESDTLINNIIYNRNIKIEEYEEILKITNVDLIRNNKSLRDNFMIEDDGFNISGGERQKILLARSLLKESKYIILDEALSEISVEEEIDIINKIFEKFHNKTIIYITHKEEIMKLFQNKYYIERSEVIC